VFAIGTTAECISVLVVFTWDPLERDIEIVDELSCLLIQWAQSLTSDAILPCELAENKFGVTVNGELWSRRTLMNIVESFDERGIFGHIICHGVTVANVPTVGSEWGVIVGSSDDKPIGAVTTGILWLARTVEPDSETLWKSSDVARMIVVHLSPFKDRNTVE
jgi:hypothetical protein